jgi:hypothetical protein
MFDAIVLNMLCKCNGCKAGLRVMVGGVGGWGGGGVRVGFVFAPGTLRHANFIPQVVLIKHFYVMLASRQL